MPSGVLCSVSNCVFWDKGNQCNADSIQVEVDKHASIDFDSEFGSIGEKHTDHASTKSTTCCYTFKPKS